MSAIPAFRYVGGKARLARRMVSVFPQAGGRYLEPFVGRGNVLFAARVYLEYEQWHANDLFTATFLRSLKRVDLRQLPPSVTYSTFIELFKRADDISRILEPRITIFGMGYQHGYDRTHGRSYYTPERYGRMCAVAKALLRSVRITGQAWHTLDYASLGPDDFVYFDPPYYGEYSPYGNITHGHLLKLLERARYKWALSGYYSNLYVRHLGEPRFITPCQSEMSAVTGNSEARDECLWINYEV